MRAEFQARELGRRQPSAREVMKAMAGGRVYCTVLYCTVLYCTVQVMEAVAGGGVRELISERYSIWSPRHYHWSQYLL